MTRCVYAIVPSATRLPRGRGFRGERLRVLRAGAVGAVVGELGRAPRQTPANLRAYHRVVEQLSAACPALLPVRFGTVLADEDEIVGMLRSRQAAFRRRLTQVRGRVQMTVRLVRPAHADASTSSTAARPPASSGAEYLFARAAAHRREEGAAECAALRLLVGRWVKAERVQPQGPVISVYHLVPRTAATAYRQVIEGAGVPGVRLMVSGPFPPFAFVDAIEREAMTRAPGVDPQRAVSG